MQVVPDFEYVTIGYILATLFFILSLKGLKTEETATGGTLCGMIGMLVMMVVVFISNYVQSEAYWILAIAIALPSIIGVVYAYKVITDKLPELVGLFNSFGGLAAAIEGVAVYTDKTAEWSVYNGIALTGTEKTIQLIVAYISIIVGSITFTGSVVAVLKLRGTISGKPTFILGDTPRGRVGHKVMQMIFLAALIGCCVCVTIIGYPYEPLTDGEWVAVHKDGAGFDRTLTENGMVGIILCILIAVVSGVIGILQTLVVSGADMAVVICVLNSGSGWSGVAAGFMISHELLLVTGAFVGASGAILSILMCNAMNCPLMRVLGFQPPPPEKKGEAAKELPWTPISTPEVKEILMAAESVIIAPGYGMAVGKAQGEIAELARTLRQMKKQVRFCIHPVAGRLPGHMNILLAEAQVPYDWVEAMADINKDFASTDVALCVGAWDTVNPAAAENPDCPVYGMPMCRVWDAKVCIVNKRSMGKATGFSGAQNLLPHKENSKMWLGNAKEQAKGLVAELRKDIGEDSAAAATGPTPPQRAGSDVSLDNAIDKLEKQIAGAANGASEALLQKLSCAKGETGKTIGVPKETSDPDGNPVHHGTEGRCALTPQSALDLRLKFGFKVIAERGLGGPAGFTDPAYEKAGVTLCTDLDQIYSADVVLKLNPPCERDGKHELERMKPGSTFIGFIGSLVWGRNSETPDAPKSLAMKEVVLRAAKYKINVLNMAFLPRISRAQKSDALSVFGKLAGNRAALEAAVHYGRIMPGEITSAGKNPQARAWVGGCGVAGLEAVAMLKKLGCDTYATDVRYVEDQVVSVGGTFVHYDLENLRKAATGSQAYAGVQGAEAMKMSNEMYKQWCPSMDIMVLTAAIPGAPPPKLVSREMVESMKPGSVIVDIAASHKFAKEYKKGDPSSPWPGNCELTSPGDWTLTDSGVLIVGYTDLPARFAQQSTEFYANCLANLMEDMCFKGTIRERGAQKPEVGTALDFKVDMTVIREQEKPSDSEKGTSSYYTGTYAVGDDVMAGMTVVKVEGDESFIDFPKPPPKPMMTAQAQFENKIKDLSSAQMIQEQDKCQAERDQAFQLLRSAYNTEDPEKLLAVLDQCPTAVEKIEAIKRFEKAKDADGYVKSLPKLIEKKITEEAKAASATKAESKGSSVQTLVIAGISIVVCFIAMALGPAPPLFIGNVMVFLLASFLGYHLITEVKPSLYTPLMSMSNAISGIVIVGGMLQVQGEHLWPEQGSATQILGAIAVAVAAINVAGGFAVTFRMLSMFKKS